MSLVKNLHNEKIRNKNEQNDKLGYNRFDSDIEGTSFISSRLLQEKTQNTRWKRNNSIGIFII